MRAAATDESTPPLIAASTLIADAPAAARAACRARATAPGSTCSAASTSASTLVCPNDNRSDPRALAGSAPIAISTCDGCATPAVQADPVEHSIPLASNNISSASPSHPRKVKCALPGSRRAIRGTVEASVVDRRPAHRRSDGRAAAAAARCWPPARRRRAASRVAMPTAPATSGVPERMSRS